MFLDIFIKVIDISEYYETNSTHVIFEEIYDIINYLEID